MELSRRDKINDIYLKLLNTNHHTISGCNCVRGAEACNCGLQELISKVSELLLDLKDQDYFSYK